jgi:hypothetical protein
MFTGWLRGSRTIAAVLVVEAALVFAVLIPVARAARVRAVWGGLGRVRQFVLGAMLLCALAAQFGFGSRLFPFVDWRMYSSLPSGDPVVFVYDVELRDGRREALVPGRFMGPESADRYVERLRRDVLDGHAEGALRVLARMYSRRTGRAVRFVVVSSQRVYVDGGRRGPLRERLRVAL